MANDLNASLATGTVARKFPALQGGKGCLTTSGPYRWAVEQETITVIFAPGSGARRSPSLAASGISGI